MGGAWGWLGGCCVGDLGLEFSTVLQSCPGWVESRYSPLYKKLSWGKEGASMAWALKLPLADEVIESGLVQDFDASLSGIGQELGAGAYSMR